MYGKAINKKKLEDDFVKYLNEITPQNDFFQVYKETVLDLWEENGQSFKLEAQKYEKQIAELEGRRKRIFEMREDESYTAEEFRERKAEIENKIMATKISLSEARIEQFDIEASLTYAKYFICNLGRQWQDLATSHSRFQKFIFPEGITYKRNKGFGTVKLGLIYEFNQTCGTDKSLLVHHLLIHWNQILAELAQWLELKNSINLIS